MYRGQGGLTLLGGQGSGRSDTAVVCEWSGRSDTGGQGVRGSGRSDTGGPGVRGSGEVSDPSLTLPGVQGSRQPKFRSARALCVCVSRCNPVPGTPPKNHAHAHLTPHTRNPILRVQCARIPLSAPAACTHSTKHILTRAATGQSDTLECFQPTAALTKV